MSLEDTESTNGNHPAIGDANETILLPSGTGDMKEFTLKCSYELADVVSRGPGGFIGAINRCRNWDLDTVSQVVKLGCDNLARTDIRKVKTAVYGGGIAEIAPACIRLIEALCFGGRRPPDPDTEPDSEATAPDPLAASA